MNLFRKVVASITLAALVVSTGASSVSAYTNDDIANANGLAAAGVINDNSANPADYNFASLLLRSEAAKIAVNLDSDVSMKTTCDNSFADVTATTPNTWVCGYAEALLDAGKISANTNFNPLSNLTKSEATKMFLEAAGCTDVYTNAATWQAETVAFAADNGIVASYSDYNTPATRAFVFEVAYNAMNTCPVAELECDDTMAALGLCEIADNTDTTDTTDNTDTTTDTSNEGAMVELSPQTPVDGTIAAGSPRTVMLAVDVTAGDTDLVLKDADLEYTGVSNEADISLLAIYLGNDKVSKGTNNQFDSENEETIKFDKDTVIMAGQTKTLFITATIAGGIVNASHQVTLAALNSTDGEISGSPIAGATFNPVSVTNKGKVKTSADKATKDLNVGEEGKIAGFKVEETSNKEDVLFKSFTLSATANTNIDIEDDLANISVLVDGSEVLAGLSVNNDEEIVIDLETAIPADDEIEIEVRGTVTSFDVSSPVLELEITDAYLVGANSGVSLELDNDATVGNPVVFETVSSVLDIIGGDINVSFTKSDIDEASPEATDVLIGTLKLTSTADYLVDTITVTVTGNDADIEELRLGNDTEDSKAGQVYTFEDINLEAGVENELELEIDLDENAVNGDNLKFDVKIVQITDEINDDTVYTDGGANDLNDIISSNDFDHDIDVEFANLKLSGTDFNNRTLVVANNVETVVYRGNVKVGDAGLVSLEDIDFQATMDFGYGDYSSAPDFDDLFKDVTLNVGGQTASADDISAAGLIEFDSLGFDIAAGSNNVEVLLTATLANEDVNNGSVVTVDVVNGSIAIEDSEGNDTNVVTTLVPATTATASASTSSSAVSDTGYNATIFNDRGEITITQVNDSDYEDDVEDTVLAGTDAIIAQLEIESKYEATEVKELRFTIPGNFRTSFSEVSLISAEGLNVVADAADYDGTNTIITFEDFVVPATDSSVDAKVVASVKTYSTAGDTDVVNLGAVTATLDTVLAQTGAEYDNYKGADSKEQLTTVTVASSATDTVTIVPATVTVAISDSFGASDAVSTISFTINEGNNDLDGDKITITSFPTGDFSTVLDDDLAAFVAGVEIKDGDEFKLEVNTTGIKVLNVSGIQFKVGTDGPYGVTNTKNMDLGTYTN